MSLKNILKGTDVFSLFSKKFFDCIIHLKLRFFIDTFEYSYTVISVLLLSIFLLLSYVI
jgi:hypothetical protein